MSEVIVFAFDCLNLVWQLISTYWILSISFLIIVIGFIVDLVKGSSEQ